MRTALYRRPIWVVAAIAVAALSCTVTTEEQQLPDSPPFHSARISLLQDRFLGLPIRYVGADVVVQTDTPIESVLNLSFLGPFRPSMTPADAIRLLGPASSNANSADGNWQVYELPDAVVAISCSAGSPTDCHSMLKVTDIKTPLNQVFPAVLRNYIELARSSGPRVDTRWLQLIDGNSALAYCFEGGFKGTLHWSQFRPANRERP